MRLLCLAIAFFALPVFAQDYEREARWADEFVPAIVVGDAVKITAASGRDFVAIHAPGKPRQAAIVLAHGVGVHPDHGMIGTLRTRLNDLGYTTLSIQMPVASKTAEVGDYFPKLFPDAADRLHRAGLWLKSKGAPQVVLVSHSMGSWMSNEYLDNHYRATPYSAWVAMGLTGSFSWTMRRYTLPVLDVMGEADLPPVVAAKGRRAFALDSSNGSRQVVVPGTDHHYTRQEAVLAEAIHQFLRGLKATATN
jgi:triacylglycerol esterase/lipase EstA (alpha/beta hydrolase family)